MMANSNCQNCGHGDRFRSEMEADPEVAEKAQLIARITELRHRQRVLLVEKELAEHELISETTRVKMQELLKTTQEIERHLEAEGEFISIYLKGRVDRLKKEVATLRGKLAERGREVAQSFREMSPEEILRCKIDSNRKLIDVAKQRITETFEEIDSLTARAQRLRKIVEDLENDRKPDAHKPLVEFPKGRRASTFLPKVLRNSSGKK